MIIWASMLMAGHQCSGVDVSWGHAAMGHAVWSRSLLSQDVCQRTPALRVIVRLVQRVQKQHHAHARRCWLPLPLPQPLSVRLHVPLHHHQRRQQIPVCMQAGNQAGRPSR